MFHNATKCKNGDNLMTKTSKENIKKDEKRIIECIMKNSNESVNAIANRCGFSRQKVWRIINRLEKSHTIWGYTAVVDGEKRYTGQIQNINPDGTLLFKCNDGKEISLHSGELSFDSF